MAEQDQTQSVVDGNEVAPAPAAQPAPAAVEVPPTVTHKTTDERKQLLAQTIQGQVAGGSRVESQSDFQAVLIRGHRPNHTLHFIIGLVTLGVWWLVWIGIAVFGGETRSMAAVDEYGNVTVQKL